ncbi:MAG: nucleoside hydrolase [Planctomycetota bacterium]
MNPRHVLLLLALLASACSSQIAQGPHPIPVIFDTDIGDDIDDTWALGFLLQCPELELKLAVGDNGKPEYRAKLLAKFLATTGHGDAPVGLGLEVGEDRSARQAAWLGDYQLAQYPGPVLRDGVQAIIDTILASDRMVTVIAVGPTQNIAEALRREPRIAQRARFVGMQGSVRVGYEGRSQIAAEYNVAVAPTACGETFAAPWPVTITPLDTCGLVALDEKAYAQVARSHDAVAAAIVANYEAWAIAGGADARRAPQRSTTLFDTVAVWLAFDHSLCGMERLGIRVDAQGFTREDPNAKSIDVATSWSDRVAFERLLVTRLIGSR